MPTVIYICTEEQKVRKAKLFHYSTIKEADMKQLKRC